MNPYLSPSKIEAYAQEFSNSCYVDGLVKIAVIKKMPNGEWTVMSLKGKPLGKYKTKEEAVKRLRQIEYFKHHKTKKKASEDSYSSIMRDLRKNYDEAAVKKFQVEFKKNFDDAVLEGTEEPENVALEKALKSVMPEDYKKAMEKAASAIDLGDPTAAGKYLADVVKFLLRRIAPEKRQHSIDNLKKKIYYINEYQIASKKVPPSSSLGQSITLLKTILLEHSPQYIREVLNNVVRNM
jgi:hypothetical protein